MDASDRPTCWSVWSNDPKEMFGATQGNRIFCGKPDGEPFATVVRPDMSTKKCPSGYKPCSMKTSLNNTICFEEGKRETCPITAVAWDAADSVKYPIGEWIRASS